MADFTAIVLDEPRRDALVELFNLAAGQAAASLGEMIGHEVVLAVPTLGFAEPHALAAALGSRDSDRVVAVRQAFDGPFHGQAVMLYPETKSLALVRMMLGPDSASSEMTELEQEAMLEIGNVVLNACLASFANMFASEIASGLPTIDRGPFDRVLGRAGGRSVEAVLLVKVEFRQSASDVAGHVVFLLDVPSVNQFFGCVDRFIASMSVAA